MKNFFYNNNIIYLIKSSLINLPTPININLWWNFGSLLGMCLLIQIITGMFLSFHYSPNINLAFNSIIHMNHNLNFGWLIHYLHMNGASMFFFCIYIHIGRNMYYNTYFNKLTWISGIIIIMLLMGTAFIGYVLPWGQMSYWGATVITNLLSAIPYIGTKIVNWIWGGFSINNATLNRFYSFHFIMPFLLLFMIIIHLMLLHELGSSNPLGLNSNLYKIPFHNYFTIKDLLGFMILFMILTLLSIMNPFLLGDPENFNSANPLITPTHIQPEWYFLFAYAILRSIPNKLGGVIALLMSILILIIMPFSNKNFIQSNKFYIFNKILFWLFINIFILLTWIGMKPVEYPFIFIGQILTLMYFSYFLINPFMFKIMNNITLNKL
uniref:Cytochrome b n=1 Tax=Habroteleia persimilis TaxID=2496286 RepID=A0A3Q8UA99_9HYME|nr:cytochrome b [Habroteleia persimilis]